MTTNEGAMNIQEEIDSAWENVEITALGKLPHPPMLFVEGFLAGNRAREKAGIAKGRELQQAAIASQQAEIDRLNFCVDALNKLSAIRVNRLEEEIASVREKHGNCLIELAEVKTQQDRLLIKYIAHVIEMEGGSFITNFEGYLNSFTPEELVILKAAEKKAEVRP